MKTTKSLFFAKSVLVSATIFCSITGLTAWAAGPTDAVGPDSSKVGHVAGQARHEPPSMETWTVAEADVLPIVMAIDANEIAAGALAVTKNVNPLITGYANMLIDHHGDNLRKSIALCKDMEGDKVGQANPGEPQLAGERTTIEPPQSVKIIQWKGAECLGRLAPLDGDAFRVAYLDDMIKGHTMALNLIDTKLMSAAVNEDLKKHLTETRESVATHLKRAQDLRAEIK